MTWSDPTNASRQWFSDTDVAWSLPIAARYSRSELLGEGSNGRVYAGFDTVLGIEVALKTLKRLGPEDAYRLKKEFRSLVDIAHPNLVRLFDLVVNAEGCFFTMELIRGVNFVSWARACIPQGGEHAPAQSWQRFRAALIQLVRGIDQLHRLGRIHRDIKPSNILVTPEDRVVVVDVGLVSRLESHQSEVSRSRSLAGTLNYMAPEQAWGHGVAPAADWYSVGVVMFEAMTGELPYQREGWRGFTRKSRPRLELERFPSVPQELAELAMQLLDPEPGMRPDAATILRRLGAEPRIVDSAHRAFRAERREELDWLNALCARARPGTVCCAHIRGPAGVGKTSVVDSFVNGLPPGSPWLVLRSRCHYREYVSFNALDGLVDDISRYMTGLSEAEIAALTPVDLASLLTAFPVLRRVEAFDRVVMTSDPGTRDVRLRHFAFMGLRELIARLSQRVQLLICIDDIQWIDNDSLVFLRAIERVSPPGQLVLLYVYRDDDESVQRPERALRQTSTTTFEVSTLVVHPLLQQQASKDELQLSAAAREAIELISVAPRPLSHRALSALGVVDEALSELQREGAIRQSTMLGKLCWEPTSAALANTVVKALGPERRTTLLEQLRAAYDSDPDADARDLLELALALGQKANAVEIALVAAKQSARRGAFATAALLYRRALALGSDPDQEWLVSADLAAALANSGRAREAADEMTRAARMIAHRADLRAESIRLRVKAGERLLLCGYWGEGFELLHAALTDFDTTYARTAAGSLLRGALRAPAALWAARRWSRSRTPEAASPDSKIQLDVVWSAGLAISWMDPMRAVELQVRHAALAYAAGDRSHIARTLTARAMILAMRGGAARWQQAEAQQTEAQRLADQSADPSAQTLVAVYSALLQFFRGQFRAATRLCEHSIDLAFARGPGLVPEIGLAQWTYLNCLSYLGEYQEVRSRLADYLLAADARNERIVMCACLVGFINFAFLCADDVEQAQEYQAEAVRTYAGRPFNSIHYLALISSCNLSLYQGDPARAWNEIIETWPALRRSMQLNMATVHAEMNDVRGRVALAVAGQAEDSATRARMLAEAESCADRLQDNSLPHAQALAAALMSGVALAKGRHKQALSCAERAQVGFERCDMPLHAAACLWRMSELSEPQRGKEQRRLAEHALAHRQVVRPERIVAVLLPRA